MELKELSKFNDWWGTGKVSNKDLESYKRYLFYEIRKYAEDRQIVLVTGLRRVGKTRLLYQIINTLLERGVDKRNILYFSFDEDAFGIKDVLEIYKRDVLRKEFKDAGKIYVFLDEIQKTDKWENKIKVYYDLYPNIKFFLSGSAALILSKKSKESLAGRIYEFVMKPLAFREFLEIKNIKTSFEDTKILNEKILPYFADFITKSGFPEIINEEDEEKIRAYVKLSVVDRIIYRDVPSQFGKTDIDLLEKLTGIFLKNPGHTLNFDNLARDLRRDKKTLMNYVYYLRFSLLVNLVSNFRISMLASSRKNRKVYPATTSMIFSLYGKLDSHIYGKALETVFCTEIGGEYYFNKGGKEIDFLIMKNEKIMKPPMQPRVKQSRFAPLSPSFARRTRGLFGSVSSSPAALHSAVNCGVFDGLKIIPVEIKYNPSEGEMKSYAMLLKRLHFKKGVMLTMDKFGNLFEYGVKIDVFPMWVFITFPDEILSGYIK